MTCETVSEAYASRAEEYTRLLGSMEATSPIDRSTVRDWAGHQQGTLLDVGCGPGHWTDWLASLHDAGELPGVTAVAGVEPTAPFVAAARRRFPRLVCHEASAEALPYDDGRVGGILSWYSLIHTHPDSIGDALDEFARVLRPGGGLCLGFFTGPEVVRFDHAITPAYFWPVEELAARVERAGFTVLSSRTRHDPDARPHADLVARRRPSGAAHRAELD